MRESYHDELNATSGRILTMAELVRVAVKDATEALIGADLTTAERVISDDSKVDALNEEIERRCFDLLARQAPVAGELRTVVAVLRMCYELARMGDLAAHVAKIPSSLPRGRRASAGRRSVRRDVEDRGFHDRESREDVGGS